MAYPAARVLRLRIREGMLRDALSEARNKGKAMGRSLKCAGRPAGGYGPPTAPPRHADSADGCANDGCTCICECHDQHRRDTT